MNKDKIKKDIEEIEMINNELDHRVSKLIALKNELRKLKRKDLANNVVTKNTIDPEILNIDVEPIAPRLLNNRTAHSDYLRHTQEQATILREIVKQGKSQNSLNNSLDSACNTKKDKIRQTPSSSQKNKVEAHSRTVKSSLKNKNCVVVLKGITNVQHSKLNANSELLCVKCNGCMLSDNHDLCVLNFINDVNARAKSISVKKRSKRKKLTALESDTPKPVVTLVYSRKPRKSKTNVPISKPKIIKSIFANKKEPSKSWGSIVSDVLSSSPDECRNDHVAKILGYGDYQIGNVTISRVYYVEGLGHNLFSIGQFCDSNLEVAFRQHTCFIRNLEGVDLLTGSRGNNLYTLSLGDMMASSPICLLSKASKTKSWLWYRRLSHLNFGTINHLARHGLVRGLPKLKFEKDHLCSACAMGKSKKKPHKPKSKYTNQEKLYLLHMDLCGPMLVASVNEKKSKDEAPDFIIKFLKMIQLRLKVPVQQIRTDNGTEFVNQTLREYYEKVGISYETSVARSSQQNGVVERRNRTLIEAARTMLIYAKASLFLWTEAVATACYTQNRSIIRLRHGKTPYELLHDKLPDLSFLHVFGALCYPTNDSENLGKLQPKADIDFDKLTAMASEHSSLEPALHEMTPTTISSGLVPNPPPSTLFVPPSSTYWDLLFQPLLDELLNPLPIVNLPAPEVIALIAKVVAPEPAASTGLPSSANIDQDALSPSNSQISPETQSPVISNDVEEENHDLDVAHMNNDPFFGILIIENVSESFSSSDVIPIVVHTAAPNSEHVNKWTKDHPLDNIIDELERPVSTRLQLHEQALFCYYNAFLTSVEPKNYKDALSQACWIKAMQEELNEFERLEFWELAPRPDKVMVISLKWIYKVKLDELGGIPKNKTRLLKTALYGLKQAPRAWYDLLSKFLLSQEFSKGTMDPTLFIKRQGKDILLSPRGIFLNQSKYALKSLKKYGMESSDPVDTPMVKKFKLDEDTQGKVVDPTHYRGMVGTLMYLNRPTLIMRVAKILDEVHLEVCNYWETDLLAGHQKGRKALFHFIKEQVENGVVELYFVNTKYQLADIFTKALGRERIKFLINKLEIRSFTPETLEQLADEAEE
ncbi:retrovirus-related pol polyprotein from transposon TNT 1-94 [Tanacetum coccineum]